MLVSTPPKTPLNNAAIGLIIAKIIPSREYVAKIESIPVVGVEIKNDMTGPFPAPSFRRYAATGITPQEHKGKGTPKADAFRTEEKLFFDKCVYILSFGIRTCNIPATRKPNKR
jgi:hypothetical protein